MTPITTIMTSDPTTIDLRNPVSDVLRSLESAPYHHLIVMDDDKPVGMVSTTDVLRLLHELDEHTDRTFRDYVDQQYTIDDVMTPELHSIPITGTVRDAAVALSQGTYHSVAVLDDQRLAGIVTTTDLARHLAALSED
jgi:acetoin utilization protein AcuB